MFGGLGMGSTYGGGLGMGNMYGGGLGMGNMYGGGLGMGNMYGGGLGMGNMYGTTLGGYSGGMGFSSGFGSGMNNNNNTLTSNTNGLLGGTTDFTGNSIGGNFPQQQQQQQGLLASRSQDQPIGSPIALGAPPPPLNETPGERAYRIRTERQKQRQLIQKQRQERKQLRLQAKMEIAGHLTNVLVQTLRSTMELFAVCFGTYYSMKAVRAFANCQEAISSGQIQRGPMGEIISRAATVGSAAVSVNSKSANTSSSGFGGRWRWIMFGILFLLAELLTAIVSRVRRPAYLSHAQRLANSVMESGCSDNAHGRISELSASEKDDSESVESLKVSEIEAPIISHDSAPIDRLLDLPSLSHNRRVYVAVYDYQAQPDLKGYLSFKAGDEFLIQDFTEGRWCKATTYPTFGTALSSTGLVPSNFLRPLGTATKL